MTADYWHDVDCNWGSTAHEYFTEDGVFHAIESAFTGREAIRQFYSWRKGRGARLARHVISNLRVVVESDQRAQAIWIMSLYAADGEPPMPSKPPIMIADIREECVREADGCWRYKSRRLIPAFTGDTPVTIPPKGHTSSNGT